MIRVAPSRKRMRKLSPSRSWVPRTAPRTYCFLAISMVTRSCSWKGDVFGIGQVPLLFPVVVPYDMVSPLFGMVFGG